MCLSAGRRLRCFPFGPTMSTAAATIHEQYFAWASVCISLADVPRSKVAASCGSSGFNPFEERPNTRCLCRFALFLSALCKVLISPHPHLFYYSHSSGCNCLFIVHSINFVSTDCVPGPVPGAGDLAVNRTGLALPSWGPETC